MIPIYRDYIIEEGPRYTPDTRWQAHDPNTDGDEPLLFGETVEDVREEIDTHLEWVADRFLRRRLVAAPVLVGVKRADGTMALYKNGKQVSLLLSEAVIAEAVVDGWYASDGWQDRLHRVIPTEDAHKALLGALAASVAAS